MQLIPALLLAAALPAATFVALDLAIPRAAAATQPTVAVEEADAGFTLGEELPEEPADDEPNESWTLLRLRAEAKRRGLTGTSNLPKAALLERLGPERALEHLVADPSVAKGRFAPRLAQWDPAEEEARARALAAERERQEREAAAARQREEEERRRQEEDRKRRAESAADPISRQHYKEMAAHYRRLATEHLEIIRDEPARQA